MNKRIVIVVVILIVAAIGAVAAANALLPRWIKGAIYEWAAQSGYERAELADVELRVLRGSAGIRDLRLVRDGASVLQVADVELRLSLRRLLSGEVHVARAALTGARIDVRRGADGVITVGGLVLPGRDVARPKTAPPLSIDTVEITDSALRLSTPNLSTAFHVDRARLESGRELDIGTIALRDLKLEIDRRDHGGWQISGSGDAMTTDATLGDDRPGADGTGGLRGMLSGLALRIGRIEVTGDSEIMYRGTLLGESVQDTLRIAEAYIADVDSTRPDRPARFAFREKDHPHLTSEFSGEVYPFRDPVDFSVRGALGTVGLPLFKRLVEKQTGLAVEGGQVQGEVVVALTRSELSGHVALAASDLNVSADGSPVLAVTHAGMRLQIPALLRGSVEVDEASLGSARLLIEQRESGEVLVAGLPVGGAAAPGAAALRIGRLRIEDGELELRSPRLRTRFHVNELRLTGGDRIDADVLTFRDLVFHLVHTGESSWRLGSDTGAMDLDVATGKPVDAQGAVFSASAWRDMSFSVNRIEVVGDSRVEYEDVSVGAPYRTTYFLHELRVSGIDSDKPEEAATVVLHATSDRHASFDVEGQAHLFLPQPGTTLAGSFAAIELTPLSPLTAAALGFHIDSGQIDGDFKVRISGAKIDGELQLRVNLLTVSTADRGKLREFEKSLPVKLTRAINLLTDKQGVMRLGVPVSGDLSALEIDLDLDINGAVNRAVNRIGSLLLFPVATATLQALLNARAVVETIPFEPLADALQARALTRIADVAGQLAKGKDDLVMVCGIAVQKDVAGLSTDTESKEEAKARALELAQRRADVVKTELVTRHDVAARRLVACRAQIKQRDRLTYEEDPFARELAETPRVEIH